MGVPTGAVGMRLPALAGGIGRANRQTRRKSSEERVYVNDRKHSRCRQRDVTPRSRTRRPDRCWREALHHTRTESHSAIL